MPSFSILGDRLAPSDTNCEPRQSGARWSRWRWDATGRHLGRPVRHTRPGTGHGSARTPTRGIRRTPKSLRNYWRDRPKSRDSERITRVETNKFPGSKGFGRPALSWPGPAGLPWVSSFECRWSLLSTPKWVAILRRTLGPSAATTPMGLLGGETPSTQGRPAGPSQPWAGLHDPFGVKTRHVGPFDKC